MHLEIICPVCEAYTEYQAVWTATRRPVTASESAEDTHAHLWEWALVRGTECGH